jgi:hypothetical protein
MTDGRASRAGGWRPPARTGFAIGVIAIALGACTLADPGTTPGASASSTSATSAPPATDFAAWTRIDLADPAPGVYGGGTPSSVVRFGDGYIAAGTVATDCCDAGDPASRRGVLWTSADGRTWILHDPVPEFAHATIGQLLTDGTRLIAVGSYALPVPNEPIAAVWTSEDGLTWDRTDGLAPSMVVVGRTGLIGVVIDDTDPSSSSAQFAASAVGLAWSLTSGEFEADVRGLAVTDDGTAMAIGAVAGAQRPDGGPTLNVVAWQTDDGTTWSGPETRALDAVPTALISDGTTFFALVNVSVQLPNGSIDSATRLWRFAAGADPVTPSVPFDREGTLETLIAMGEWLVAFGYADVAGTPTAMVWLSPNGGDTWGRVPGQDAFGGGGIRISALVETPDGLVAVGHRWDPVTMHPVPEAWLTTR